MKVSQKCATHFKKKKNTISHLKEKILITSEVLWQIMFSICRN